MLSLGWTLNFLASKGVEMLIGQRNQEAAEDQDIRWRYFGFEELIPEEQSTTDVSTNIISSAISGVVTRLTTFTPEDIVTLESICGINWETGSEDEEQNDMDASTNHVSAASGESTASTGLTPEDTCGLDLEPGLGDPDEVQSDMDSSASLVSGTSGDLTSLAAREDPVSLDSVCGPHSETCPGDTDSDVCFSADAPLENMDLAVETSCDGQEQAMNFEPVSEDPLAEEASSADGTSEDGVQDYADRFDGMDAEDVDVASEEIPSETTADRVVEHSEEASENSSENESSPEILSEDGTDFSENDNRPVYYYRRYSTIYCLNLENYVPPLDRISEVSTSEEMYSEESSEHLQTEPQHQESRDVEEEDASFEETPSESRHAENLWSRVSEWLHQQGRRLADLLPRRNR